MLPGYLMQVSPFNFANVKSALFNFFFFGKAGFAGVVVAAGVGAGA